MKLLKQYNKNVQISNYPLEAEQEKQKQHIDEIIEDLEIIINEETEFRDEVYDVDKLFNQFERRFQRIFIHEKIQEKESSLLG